MPLLAVARAQASKVGLPAPEAQEACGVQREIVAITPSRGEELVRTERHVVRLIAELLVGLDLERTQLVI